MKGILRMSESVRSVVHKNQEIKSSTVKLNNGQLMPIFGLGTFRMKDKEILDSVIEASLKNGYRLIDTATVYQNESLIGQKLQTLLPQLKIDRKDIFITSKLGPQDQGSEKVREAVVRSLKNLKLNYIDLYLIHWPGASEVDVKSAKNSILRRESWIELESCVKDGLIKSIGVSNYTLKHLKELYTYCKIPPVLNQVEYHLYYRHPPDFISFVNDKEIALQSYSTFGGDGVEYLLDDHTLKKVSQNLGYTPAQILLRWSLQNGWIVIPKTSKVERVIENSTLEFVIPKEEMLLLNKVSTRQKYAWDPTTVL